MLRNFILLFCGVFIISCGSGNQTITENIETNKDDDNKVVETTSYIVDGNSVDKLQGNWSFVTIAGVSDEDLGSCESKPTFSVADIKISGNDGCNSFSSAIREIDANKLSFSVFMGTLMHCGEMIVPNTIAQQMPKVRFYNIKDGILTLLNKNNVALFVLKKQA